MSNYARTLNSFSGVDIIPVFDGNPIGECQGISYSVQREKAPLYTLGSANPRSFSRGKRAIAGAIVFLVFDRSALFDSMKDSAYIWANDWEQPATQAARTTSIVSSATDSVNATTVAGDSNSVVNKTSMKAWYQDQIPPFDVKLLASTERGHGAIMEVLGMEILNCGGGLSVDDVTADESCTWIGINIIPWHSSTYNDPKTAKGQKGYTYDATGKGTL